MVLNICFVSRNFPLTLEPKGKHYFSSKQVKRKADIFRFSLTTFLSPTLWSPSSAGIL